MARITIEDCTNYIDNHFELVRVASMRARHLLKTGTDPLVSWNNDKATVVALREVADGHIGADWTPKMPAEQNPKSAVPKDTPARIDYRD